MTTSSRLSGFLQKALDTRKYHADKLKENPDWKLRDTSKALKCSIGAVSEALLISSWYKTHSNKMERFDSRNEALIWIRKMKLELMCGD